MQKFKSLVESAVKEVVLCIFNTSPTTLCVIVSEIFCKRDPDLTNCSLYANVYDTRGVQEIRGQMLPFPQFLTDGRETCT